MSVRYVALGLLLLQIIYVVGDDVEVDVDETGEIEEVVEPDHCYGDYFLKEFCEVPEVVGGFDFWDFDGIIFSDTVLDALIDDCSDGEWCLQVSL